MQDNVHFCVHRQTRTGFLRGFYEKTVYDIIFKEILP
jgi:hypothetical protein